MMEDDPDYGYYCETGEDNVTPVNAKRRELIASNTVTLTQQIQKSPY